MHKIVPMIITEPKEVLLMPEEFGVEELKRR
jgi:hypothetical protein